MSQARDQAHAQAWERENTTASESSLSTRSEGSPSPLDHIEGVSQEFAKKETAHRKSGPLTNLIYGTKEGREMDAQIAASFSQILARGKYVHSINFHDVKHECVEEYVALVGDWYPRMANLPENKVNLVGSWRTEVGDCDTFGKSPGDAPPLSREAFSVSNGCA